MKRLPSLSALAALALSACATPPPTYAPAAGLTPETGATITGSRDSFADSPYSSRITVLKIDGVITEAGIATFSQWDDRELVAPGPHSLEVRATLIKYGLSARIGAAVIPFAARAGESYAVRSWARPDQETDRERMDLWVETANGDRSSPVVTVPVFLPRGGPVVVPATKSSPMMILDQ